MSRLEVQNLLERIKIFRNSFTYGFDEYLKTKMVDEWEKVLRNYDANDLNDSLDAFVKNEENRGKIPDLFQLIKNVLTIEDKKCKGNFFTYCKFCGKKLDYKFECRNHEDRCRSIKYISKIYIKYFNRELEQLDEMYKMNKKEFDEKYVQLLKKILPLAKEKRTREANVIENVIETFYGRKAKFDIEGI